MITQCAEDLFEFDQVRAVRFEPGGKPLVQLCARQLRQTVIGRVSDQEMAEIATLSRGPDAGVDSDVAGH